VAKTKFTKLEREFKGKQNNKSSYATWNANGANISVNKSISHTALLSSITANFFIIIF